jgi:hypothetical protein
LRYLESVPAIAFGRKQSTINTSNETFPVFVFYAPCSTQDDRDAYAMFAGPKQIFFQNNESTKPVLFPISKTIRVH